MGETGSRLVEHVFEDTGRVVQIRKVSPLLGAKLRRRYPPPSPPTQEVDYGTPERPDVRIEENAEHPDHVQAVEEYRVAFQDKMQGLLIRRGVVVEWDAAKRADVKELREFWQEAYEEPLDGSDLVVYVCYICVGTPKDLDELVTAIMLRSQPTREAVTAARDTFPGGVPGA